MKMSKPFKSVPTVGRNISEKDPNHNVSKTKGLASWVLTLLFAMTMIVSASPARADAINDWTDMLYHNADFRIRTQAALKLGGSGDTRAISPLCGGLDDYVATVRSASAAGMGKLALGGVKCLERHLDTESSADVRSVIQTSIDRIRQAQSGGVVSTEYQAYNNMLYLQN